MATVEDNSTDTGTPQQSEITPLLRTLHGSKAVAKPSVRTFSPFLIFPVAFGSHAAASIVSTTTVDILRHLCCQWWYSIHDPNSIPQGGRLPDALCQLPEVEVLFTKAFNIDVLSETIGNLIASALIGKFASKYGRKPVLLASTFMAILSTASFLSAVYIPIGVLQLPLLGLWLVLGMLSGPLSIALLCTMFVVDTTNEPAKRTASLTFLTAVVMGALAPGYALGGAITQWTGTGATVFFTAVTISILVELYIIFVVPETFTPGGSQTSDGAQLDGGGLTGHKSRNLIERVSDSLGSLLHPFKLIFPQSEHGPGKNYRLIILAFVAFAVNAGSSYVAPAFILYGTTTFYMKTNETGYVLSMVALAKVLFMTFVLPLLLELRPGFEKVFPSTHKGLAQSSEGAQDAEPAGVSSPSTRFDVLVLALSLLLDIVTLTAVGLAGSKIQLTISMVMFSFGAGAVPALQTIVTASSERTVSGELLSAFQIINVLGSLCAMIGLGAVLTMTISTQPYIVFFLCGGFLAAGTFLLTFVRDSDRWNP